MRRHTLRDHDRAVEREHEDARPEPDGAGRGGEEREPLERVGHHGLGVTGHAAVGGVRVAGLVVLRDEHVFDGPHALDAHLLAHGAEAGHPVGVDDGVTREPGEYAELHGAILPSR